MLRRLVRKALCPPRTVFICINRTSPLVSDMPRNYTAASTPSKLVRDFETGLSSEPDIPFVCGFRSNAREDDQMRKVVGQAGVRPG